MIVAKFKIQEAIDRYNAGRDVPESAQLIAVASGLHVTTMDKILRGVNKPSIDTLEKLANYMGITDIKDLVEFEQIP